MQTPLSNGARTVRCAFTRERARPPWTDFAAWLGAGLETADTSAIMRYLQRREWAAGNIVVKMGAEADSLMLVESGRVDVVGQNHKGETVRLRSILGRQ